MIMGFAEYCFVVLDENQQWTMLDLPAPTITTSGVDVSPLAAALQVISIRL
jgi:hypothetical protein